MGKKSLKLLSVSSHKKFFAWAILATSLALPSTLFAADLPVDAGTVQALRAGIDPAQELRRTQEEIENERIRREMEEHRESAGGIDAPAPKDETAAPAVKFVLHDVVLDSTELIPSDVVKSSYADFIGKETSIDDLYKIVANLNDWYKKHNYLTCRAYLPPQTIHEGVVHIALIEGKNGNVTIEGNRTTRDGYIKDRLGIEEGKIEDMSELNEKLEWFNGTNDVKLHITLKAGEKTGTTDYVIEAYEPKRDAWTLYMDRAGSETTGRWRRGIFYTNRSLTGVRDALSLGYINAQGLDSVSMSYAFPVGRSGTRLSLDYSRNSTEVINGIYVDWDIPVRGHATSYGLTLTQPLSVTGRGKTEASFAISRTRSDTDILELPMLRDRFQDFTAALARTNYGDGWACYRKYAYTFGSWDSDSEYQFRESKNYSIFNFNGIYQRGAKHGQLFTVRTSAQWSLTDDLRPSKQFFIGGVTTVRGYPENEIGADKGAVVSLEYSVPASKGVSLYTFFDWGHLFGDTTYDEKTLMGAGLGVRAKLFDGCALDMAAGFPLKKDVARTHVDSCRLHLSLVANF
ncbi:MAG: ShlB/FhaC/HecB family hemolysin secretion/activation protein [Selenomonadaceae bacterium]